MQIPDLPGLHRRRDIQRALRPLRQYGPSRRHHIIDEDATATFIASTGVWAPVMRPAPERWFDVVLAVDSSSSMDLWRPLISDLHKVLAGTGAFRDIRDWRLTPQEQAIIVQPNPGAAARSPRELIDGAGRRLFFVVTDGAADGWHDGSATNALADWGKTGPVAVLQPLPEEMWSRTGLAAVPARLSTNKSGARNSQLRVDYRRRRRSTGMPVPVLGIEPDALYSWARLVGGSASAVSLAVTSAIDDQPTVPSLMDDNELGSAVDRFRASASPQAYQLAVCLSAVPLTLPIMRLVQHVAVPASNPSALAEVILGGLISRTGGNTYEFLPGIRDALLSELRRSEITTVFSAISAYITQHVGTASSTFPAIAETADGPVAAAGEAFSWVPPAVAARLGLPAVSQQQVKDRSPDQTIPLNDERQNEQLSVPAARQLDQDRDMAEGGTSADALSAAVASADSRPGSSAYLLQVRRIAPADPPGLIGREAELAELARFCLEPRRGQYVWWQGEAWAGKSALLSWFVLHPPPRVRVVSFFVTARMAGQDTREAFAQVLLEQLADLTEQELPLVLPRATQDTYLLDLLDQAAEACQEPGGRLVLVVDGLDEDRGVTTDPDAHSIAALLPADPPGGMRVIVTGRPDPPVPDDVPDWHPLRDPGIIRPLEPSPHAQDVQRLGKQELQRLLHGSTVEQDLLGLLTAAGGGGGLSRRDLEELTGNSLWDIERILHTAAGRTFSRRTSRWTREAGPDVYLLAQEELQTAATRYLGSARLANYRDRLHEWAGTYHAQGWPPGTSEYLLDGYFWWLLRTTGDLPRMLDLALDSARQDRMLDVTGNDDAALAQIVAIQDFVVNLPEPNLDPTVRTRIMALAEAIQGRNPHIPTALPVVWAYLGQLPHAGYLADSITDPRRKAEALLEVARVKAIVGEPDLAATRPAGTEGQARVLGDRRHAGETADVTLVADDFTAWLVGLLAGTGRRKLTTLVLGSAQEHALRQAAKAAIESTAAELEPSDSDQARQLAMVVSEVFSDPAPAAPSAGQTTLLEALQARIAERLAVLDDAALTGMGHSSAEMSGAPGDVLTEVLIRHLVQEIMLRGSRGGPLAPLADQLNHDATHLQGHRLEGALAQLAGQVRPLADVGTDRSAEPVTENIEASVREANQAGDAGDAAGARDQYAALLPDFERVLGPEHPDTLTARSNLALWTGQAGDAAGARDQYAALLPDFERVLGPEHPDTLTARSNLALWTGQAGDAAGTRDQYAAQLPDQPEIVAASPHSGRESSGPKAKLFISYSHRDERYREQLVTHLAGLRRQGVIADWHDRKIIPGQEWREAIDQNLDAADCVLLLISADFVASDYCYSIEMQRTLEKHREGRVLVIPVIVRPADWQHTPLSELQALPKDAKPVVEWARRDRAWLSVTEGLRVALASVQRTLDTAGDQPEPAVEADLEPHPEAELSTDELIPVEPVMPFSMADPRIIDPVDVISDIDKPSNPLELAPNQFEAEQRPTGRKLLIVEDQIGDTIVTALESAGYACTVITSFDAWKELRGQGLDEYDGALIDLHLTSSDYDSLGMLIIKHLRDTTQIPTALMASNLPYTRHSDRQRMLAEYRLVDLIEKDHRDRGLQDLVATARLLTGPDEESRRHRLSTWIEATVYKVTREAMQQEGGKLTQHQLQACLRAANQARDAIRSGSLNEAQRKVDNLCLMYS